MPTLEENTAPVNSITEEVTPRENISFVKPAPNFSDLIWDLQGRDTTVIDSNENPHTEREAMLDLWDWLNKAYRNSNLEEPDKLEVVDLLDNLKFIGSKELAEALDFFKSETIKRITSGRNIVFYSPSSSRSSIYLTHLLLESLRKEAEINPDLLTFFPKLKFVSSLQDRYVPDFFEEETDAITLDDFVITGSKIFGAISSLNKSNLAKNGARVETWLVACPEKGKELDSKILVYYSLPEVRSFDSIHVTGVHCTVDYGYETPIRLISEKLDIVPPILYQIKRPYETFVSSQRYVDPVLEEVRIQNMNAFGVNNFVSSIN